MNLLEDNNKEFYRRLSRFVKSKIQNREDAEEITQDILLKILQNPKRHTIDNLSAWAFSIAKNTIIDFYRRKKVEINSSLDELYMADEEDEGNYREIALCMAPLINMLPTDDQAILKAIELEGIPQKRYAAQHGLPYSTAKSKIQRARKKLKAALEKCCRLEFDRHGMPTQCKGQSKC